MSFFNRKLALALAWIALVGGGVSLVSGAAPGLAVWVALVLAGLGCQAIVTVSSAGDTGRAANLEAQERALLDEFHRLLEECSSQFARQLEVVRGELGQVQNLLSEAIVTLTSIFHRLHEHACAQRDVAVSVVEGAVGGTGTREFEGFVKDISGVMQRVVDRVIANSVAGMDLVETTGRIAECQRQLEGLLPAIGALAGQADQVAADAAGEAARSGGGVTPMAAAVRDLSVRTTYLGVEVTQAIERMHDTVRKAEEAIQRIAGQDLGFAFESKQRIEEIASAMDVQNKARVGALGQLGHVADDVDTQVGRAVTALQFQDIVSQLLDHVGRRIDAMDDVWTHLAELARTLQRNAATVDAPDALRSLQAETCRVSARLSEMVQATENNPVSQRGLDQGAVELF